VSFTQRRIAIMSEILAVPPQRITLWNFAQMVLSAWWCYEDSGAVDADAMALIAPFRTVAQQYR
jgi:streptomycin 6-kinase